MNRKERRLWDKGKHPIQQEIQRRKGMERKTPMKRSEIQRSRQPMKKVSKKRESENVIRRRVLAQLRKERGGCELRVLADCSREMTDGHEILTRGRGGSITDPSNILMACRRCHTVVTDNPAESDCYGFTVQEWRADEEGRADAERRRDTFHSGVLPECADWCKAASHKPNG